MRARYDGPFNDFASVVPQMDANRLMGTHVNIRPSPQEYGLTVGYIQRYKIPIGMCIFVYMLIMLESAPAYPTMREWRNWQTRET